MAVPDSTEIEWAVLGIKKDVFSFEYHSFLRLLHLRVFELLESNGRNPDRCWLHKGSDFYFAVANKTDNAAFLTRLLGYQETEEVPDALIVVDLASYRSKLESFLQIAGKESAISRGDLIALQPLADSTDFETSVAYLVYHLHLRLQLVLSCTLNHMFGFVENDMQFSVAAIDKTADQLGLLQEESTVKVLWDIAKSKVCQHVASRGKQHDLSEVDAELDTVADALKADLRRRLSSKVRALFPHLQNMQGIIIRIAGGRMLEKHEVATYLRNSVEISNSMFTNEYISSLETIRSLMEEALTRELSPEEIDKVFTTAIWQSENVLSHFKKHTRTSQRRSQDKSERSVPRRSAMERQESSSLWNQTQMDESMKSSLREILDVLKDSVGFFIYRNFVRVVHFGVERLVKDGGAPPAIAINKNEPNFAAVSVMTDVGMNLMYLLGYNDVEMLPDSMVMTNYHESESRLRAFLEIGRDALLLTHGDPAGATPVASIGGIPLQVAHLAYHFELRCKLLTLYTIHHILPSLEHEIRTAMSAVEELADKLRVMPIGGETRRLWNTAKQNILKYIACPDTYEKELLHNEIHAVGGKLAVELDAFIPRSLSRLIPYLNMVQGVTGVTAVGEMFNLSGIESYLSVVQQLLRSAFTSDYIQASDDVCRIMRIAQTRECTEDEIAQVFSLSSWQSDHFLTAFIPQAYNMPGHIPAIEYVTSTGLESGYCDNSEDRLTSVVSVESGSELDGKEKKNINAREKYEKEETEKEYSVASGGCESSDRENTSEHGFDYEFPFLVDLDTFDVEVLQVALPAVRRSGKLALLRERLSQLTTSITDDMRVLMQGIEDLRAAQCSDILVIRQALEQGQREKQQEVECAQRTLSCLKVAMRMVNETTLRRHVKEIKTIDIMRFLRTTLEGIRESRDLLRRLHSLVDLEENTTNF